MSIGKVEIRKFLVSKGYSENELKSKKVDELRDIMDVVVKQESASNSLLDSVEPEEEDGEAEAMPDVEDAVEDRPTPSSPEWTQYVLGKFMDDEVDGENPRVEGLRRVSESLIGPILKEDCELIQPPRHDNGMTACVKAIITFYDMELQREVSYAALADAHEGNIFRSEQTDYTIYLTSMADTRAKGRAFRNALKLRRVVAAEEIGGGIGLISNESAAKNSGVQISFAVLMCKRLGLEPTELVESLELKHEKKDGKADLSSLSDEDMMSLLKKVNELNAEGLKNG